MGEAAKNKAVQNKAIQSEAAKSEAVSGKALLAQEGQQRIETQTHPAAYQHWRLQIDGAVAQLALDVQEDKGLREDYTLRLNSYDLGVDIELADAITRLRFEQPQVRVVVVSSAHDGVFCAGANIFMLKGSSHPFKVNFCKYTNETRLAMEEASALSQQRYLAAVNGVCSGGGYELALACDEIHLIDDRSSAVSLPETPFLGVLPGTGGLTRLVDKRYVRRDLADVFATLAEGIRGQKALQWGLVDAVHPRSSFDQRVTARVDELLQKTEPAQDAAPETSTKQGVPLAPLEKRRDAEGLHYRHVTVRIDAKTHRAELTVRGPSVSPAPGVDPLAEGCDWYPLAVFRELDDALVELRFNFEEVGVLLLRTRGALEHVMAWDAYLEAHREHWFVRETMLLQRRTLKRLDLTARSIFALIDAQSCFGGFFTELALASDRQYMLDDAEHPPQFALSPLNGRPDGVTYPLGNGLSRLAQRFLGDAERLRSLLDAAARRQHYTPSEALAAGLVTATPDELDWDDAIRLAVEERVSFSPDALTGMEASLRFAGPETMETKIFGRLSAWQNWIFQRPNATGEAGALNLYGEPRSPEFDFRRT